MITPNIQTPQTLITERGVSLLWGNKQLYSNRDPKKRAITIAKSINITPMTLYILPSPLLFYGIKEFISRIDTNSIIICLELEKGLQQLTNSEYINFLKNNKQIKQLQNENRFFLQNRTANELLKLVKEYKIIENVRRVSLVSLSGGYDLNKNRYNQIFNELSDSIALFWKNRSTIKHLSELWYRNIFTNIETVKRASALIKLNPNNLQCAVLGAGETTEQTFNQLKQNRDKYYIIVADTALPSLIEASITPDCCVALEAQHHNLRDFITKTKEFDKIHLIAELSSSPSVIRKFKNISLFFTRFSNATLFDRIEKKFPSIFEAPQLGSVGISALFFALMLSNKPIYSGGLDFAYKRGKSHCNGTFFHKLLLHNSKRTNPQSNNYRVTVNESNIKEEGNTIITNTVLENYKRSCVELATLFKIDVEGFSLIKNNYSLSKSTIGIRWKFPQSQLVINDKNIVDFFNNEYLILETIIKKRDGLEELIYDKTVGDYLTDTIKLKSTQSVSNEIAAIIKLRATRYKKIIENSINRI